VYKKHLPKCVESAEAWYQYDVNRVAVSEPILFSHGPRPLERFDTYPSRYFTQSMRCCQWPASPLPR